PMTSPAPSTSGEGSAPWGGNSPVGLLRGPMAWAFETMNNPFFVMLTPRRGQFSLVRRSGTWPQGSREPPDRGVPEPDEGGQDDELRGREGRLGLGRRELRHRRHLLEELGDQHQAVQVLR